MEIFIIGLRHGLKSKTKSCAKWFRIKLVSCSIWCSSGQCPRTIAILIFINDIDTAVDAVNCVLIKFADDAKGLQKVDSPNDAHKLQNNLNNLFEWSKEWQMLFNLEKCHVLHFGSKTPKNTYTIDSRPLIHVDEEKDLGVLITSSCTPSKLVGSAAKKVTKFSVSFSEPLLSEIG